MNKNTRFLFLLLLILFANRSFALPDTESGLTIGGVIIDGTFGIPSYNVDTLYSETFVGFINPGEQFPCNAPFHVQTGGSTNSFFNDVDFSGCPNLSGFGASYSLFGNLSTTLSSNFPGGGVELVRLSRSTPSAPIDLTFEPYGLPQNDPITVVAEVTDQNGNTLYTSNSANANVVGIGEQGSTLFNVILDGIPTDVISANVDRYLVLTFTINSLVVRIDPFRLTYMAGGCVELLHIGANEPASMPSQAVFGCSTLVPPGNCLDKSNAALAIARDYKAATRKVQRLCGRKQSTECPTLLQQQINTFQLLTQAQQEVETYCGM